MIDVSNKQIDAILLDCDGTLSSIEGIDELALMAGAEKARAVQMLTAEAMGKTGLNPEVYEKRLALVAPNKNQVEQLGEKYFTHITPDADVVISLLQKLGKSIYILSAGLFPSVSIFAKHLQIPAENVFAVKIQFDEKGNYKDFDHTSPLIHNHGKREIVQQLKNHHSEFLYVGDGMNDLAVRDLVTGFIGYGGNFFRQNIADQSDFYIKAQSLLPLLPLSLTENEYKNLSDEDKRLYEEGKHMLG